MKSTKQTNTAQPPHNSRREFTRGALAAAALTGAGMLAPRRAKAQPTVTPEVKWRMATSWPTNFPIFEHGALRFAANVAAMSGGRMQIEVDSASKHKAALDVFDYVREGQFEMGHSCSYYWKGKDASLTTLAAMPFGMNAQEFNAWFWYDGGIELMNAAYARHGMYSYNAGNTGVQMGGWFRKEIKSPADFHGLKMRIPGLAGEVLARIGAEPVVIPAGELYTSLERGVIDALEWVGPHMDVSMGFQQIAKFYYTGWHEPGTELQYLINRNKYDALPEDLRRILQVAMRESSFDMLCESEYRNAQTWAQMHQDYPDVQIRSFPREVLDALRRETNAVLDEMIAASPESAAIIDSQRAFLKKAAAWTAVSRGDFYRVRELTGADLMA